MNIKSFNSYSPTTYPGKALSLTAQTNTESCSHTSNKSVAPDSANLVKFSAAKKSYTEPSGVTVTEYTDGTISRKHLDGTICYHYLNGDVRATNPNTGIISRYYAETGDTKITGPSHITQINKNNGDVIIKDRFFNKTTIYKDSGNIRNTNPITGLTHLRYARSGITKIINAIGEIFWYSPDHRLLNIGIKSSLNPNASAFSSPSNKNLNPIQESVQKFFEKRKQRKADAILSKKPSEHI